MVTTPLFRYYCIRREIRFTRTSKYRASTSLCFGAVGWSPVSLGLPQVHLVRSTRKLSLASFGSAPFSSRPFFFLSLFLNLSLFLSGFIRCSRSRRLIFFLCFPGPGRFSIVWPIGVVGRVCTPAQGKRLNLAACRGTVGDERGGRDNERWTRAGVGETEGEEASKEKQEG